MTPPIVTNVNPPLTMSANEENLQAFCFSLASLSHREICHQEGYDWVFTYPSIWPNFVFNLNLDNPHVLYNSRLIRRRMALDFHPKWLVMNEIHDNGLWLSQNGFQLNRQWAGMTAQLTTLPTNIPSVEGLTIIQVDNEATFQQWLSVVNPALFAEESLDGKMFGKMLNSADTRFYLGLLDGEPVATSLLYLSAGVAGIYMVSTLPAYRQQGIGQLITLAPMQTAQQMGYQVATLQATPMGARLYQKIGFEQIFWYNLYGIRR